MSREIWTPQDRCNFIKEAVYSKSERGHRGPYQFNVYPKIDGTQNDELEVRRSIITEAFAKVIYTKNPKYRYMSLGFYYMLVEKIRLNNRVSHYLWRDIMVIIKGANAYTYLTSDSDLFPFSDLDIMIYINPELEDATFNDIKKELRILVLQTISQYKRLLDNMFFTTGQNKFKDSDMYKETCLFDEDTIASFKKDFNDEVEKLNAKKAFNKSIVISPFEDDQIRNDCSRYSFLITKSEGHDESVVKVDVPHFDMCENIPLKKSPFFSSYNETINFNRTSVSGDSESEASTSVGQFDLYRIRFNNLLVEFTDEGKAVKDERIAADFIDVSIASKKDAELIDFWNTARCEHIMDPNACLWKVQRDGKWETTSCWLIMPNIATCINDLYKMLNIYECPESKKNKREIRYTELKRIAGM